MRKLQMLVVAVLVLSGLVVGVPTASADDTECGSVLAGPVDNVIVPSESVCILTAAMVSGNVLVQPDAALFIELGTTITGSVEVMERSLTVLTEATIAGNVVAQRDAGFFIEPGGSVLGNVEVKEDAATGSLEGSIGGDYKCDKCFFQDVIGSTVGGSVEVVGSHDGDFIIDSTILGNLSISESNAGGFAFILAGTTISGNLIFQKNVGPTVISGNTIASDLQIFENNVAEGSCPPENCGEPVVNGLFDGNQVGGNMQVFKNMGETDIVANTIVGNLQCFDNVPPPGGEGNVAPKAEGQCSTLVGLPV